MSVALLSWARRTPLLPSTGFHFRVKSRAASVTSEKEKKPQIPKQKLFALSTLRISHISTEVVVCLISFKKPFLAPIALGIRNQTYPLILALSAQEVGWWALTSYGTPGCRLPSYEKERLILSFRIRGPDSAVILGCILNDWFCIIFFIFPWLKVDDQTAANDIWLRRSVSHWQTGRYFISGGNDYANRYQARSRNEAGL